MTTRDPHARSLSSDVLVRIVPDSFPEWQAAMRNDPTYQKIANNAWWAYVSSDEYERFCAVAIAAPGYGAWPVTAPFYAT